MKNPFEQLHNTPPHAEKQFEEVTLEEQAQLVDDAKAKMEGVLLYAPIADDIKTSLLARLDAVSFSRNDILPEPYQTLGMSDEQRASLWLDRKMRGAISDTKEALGRNDHDFLTLMMDRLYGDPSPHFDEIISKWMDSKK